MAFFLLLLLCFTAGVRVGQAAAPLAAPSSSVDCSSEVINLLGCLPFVRNGSNATRPDAGCCSGLRKVLDEAASCLCQISGQSQGQARAFDVNVTKALTLPSACGVSNSSAASNCNISIPGAPAAAAAAPGHSPSHGAPSSVVSGVEFLSSFAVALWLYYQSR